MSRLNPHQPTYTYNEWLNKLGKCKCHEEDEYVQGYRDGLVSHGSYILCDVDACAKSKRTRDIPFFDLANDEYLLNKLELHYLVGNVGLEYNYESRGKWFAGYISSFSKATGNSNAILEKLKTNPKKLKYVNTRNYWMDMPNWSMDIT